MDIMKIDGAYGEGGGQILRSAVTLSCITKTPIQIDNIRKNRKVTGLRAQHLTSIKLLAKICDAKVEGLQIGSTSLKFSPSNVDNNELTEDIGTAGSIPLILQALIPAVAITKKKLKLSIVGGTDVPWSPTSDYTQYVLAEAFSRMGIRFSMKVKKRGYYPRGGGRIDLEVFPINKLEPIILSKRKIKYASLFCVNSNLDETQVESEISKIIKTLEINNFNTKIRTTKELSLNDGGSILLFSKDHDSIVGSDCLIKKDNLENVGTVLVQKFLKFNQSLDNHLSDMLVVPASLADGTSIFNVSEITKHLETNLYVTSKITNTKYGIGKLDHGYEVRIDGNSSTRVQ